MLDFLRRHVWSELPAEPRRKDRVLAAFAWGLGFPLVFGGIHAWRHRGEPDAWGLFLWLLVPGALLAGSLLVAPVGKHVYLAVMRVAATIGFVLSTLFLTIFFYLVVTPLGWFVRVTGRSSVDLAFRSGAPPAWRARAGNPPPERYYRLS